MTTYAPTFTPRIRLKYLAAGIEHTVQGRGARGDSSSTIDGKKTQIRNALNLLAAQIADDFTWLSAEYALTDSDTFFSTVVPDPIVGLVDRTTMSLRQRATSTNFVGSAVASRAAIYFYGINWEEGLGTPADNGRVTPAEVAAIGTMATSLSGSLHAGSGASALFHPYANIKINDGLLKKLRQGTIS